MIEPLVVGLALSAVVIIILYLTLKYITTAEAARIAFTVYKISEQVVDEGQERIRSADKQFMAEALSLLLVKKYPPLALFLTPAVIQKQIDKIVLEANKLIDSNQKLISDYLEERM